MMDEEERRLREQLQPSLWGNGVQAWPRVESLIEYREKRYREVVEALDGMRAALEVGDRANMAEYMESRDWDRLAAALVALGPRRAALPDEVRP